jgi:hypothetical protein
MTVYRSEGPLPPNVAAIYVTGSMGADEIVAVLTRDQMAIRSAITASLLDEYPGQSFQVQIGGLPPGTVIAVGPPDEPPH